MLPNASRRAVHGAIAASTAIAALILIAGPASAVPRAAHVHVDGSAPAGGTAVLTFRVPTESATASTVALRVTLPSATPFTSVTALSKPGWTSRIVTSPLVPPVLQGSVTLASYVSEVDWTATGPGIPPGEYDEFTIRAGAAPASGELSFPAAQTYGDGTVVAWDEPTNADGSEPEHPAPTIEIAPVATPAGAASPADPVAIAGLVVAIAAFLLGGAALFRRRRTAPAA